MSRRLNYKSRSEITGCPTPCFQHPPVNLGTRCYTQSTSSGMIPSIPSPHDQDPLQTVHKRTQSSNLKQSWAKAQKHHNSHGPLTGLPHNSSAEGEGSETYTEQSKIPRSVVPSTGALIIYYRTCRAGDISDLISESIWKNPGGSVWRRAISGLGVVKEAEIKSGRNSPHQNHSQKPITGGIGDT